MAVFVLIYKLREFPLSTVTNRFQLRYQLRQQLLIATVLQYVSLLFHFDVLQKFARPKTPRLWSIGGYKFEL